MESATDQMVALFDPHPTYLLPPTVPVPPSMQPAVSPQPAPPPSTNTPASPTQPASATTRLAALVPRPTNNRPGAVLSDAQIVSIKQRLKLTPDQQQMWPAVEVALRSLTYAKHAKNSSQSARIGEIDPASTEVQHLTSAATPLIMSFSDDQKRELNVLAHVAGLEQLVPKF